VLGGNFGVWGGLFSTYDCAVKGYDSRQSLDGPTRLTSHSIRKKEDPYNAIIAGFFTVNLCQAALFGDQLIMLNREDRSLSVAALVPCATAPSAVPSFSPLSKVSV